MTEIGEAYLFLERDSRPAGSQLLTRSAGVTTDAGEVLYALDREGRRRLLVPVVDDEVSEDHRSRGVALMWDHLASEDDSAQGYAALVCLDNALTRVFERLVEDILEYLRTAELPPVRSMQLVLGEWRSFLSAAGLEINRETAVGLVGELEILSRLTNVPDPLACWRGPTGALRDFVRDEIELEVKCTTALDANTVAVTGLDQLDPSSSVDLYLAVVHLRQSDSAPSLDQRVRNLIELGLPRDRFYELLARQEYVPGQDPDAHRYEVRSVRVWHIDDHFPGLRRSDIHEPQLQGISRVRYNLALDSAPPPLDTRDADELLCNMRTAGP